MYVYMYIRKSVLSVSTIRLRMCLSTRYISMYVCMYVRIHDACIYACMSVMCRYTCLKYVRM